MRLIFTTVIGVLLFAAPAHAQVLELSTWPVIPALDTGSHDATPQPETGQGTAIEAVRTDDQEGRWNVQDPAQVASAQDPDNTPQAMVRPPNPCNPFDPQCNGYPPGTVIIPPARPDVPCNPYRFDDPCNGYPPLPPGTIVVPPPRPSIPCNKYSADRHCPGGVWTG